MWTKLRSAPKTHKRRSGKRAPTLREFVPEFLRFQQAEGNSDSEASSKSTILRVHLLPVFGDKRLNEITVRDIDDYRMSKLAPEPPTKALAPKTVNNQLAVLRRIYTVAERWGLVDRAPYIPLMTKRKLREGRTDFLTFEEARTFLGAVERLYPEHWLFVFVALRTGLRLGELRALRWKEIDLDSGLLVVSRAFSREAYEIDVADEAGAQEPGVRLPKWGRSRSVPLPSDALSQLRRAQEGSEHRLVFPGFSTHAPIAGGFRSANSIQNALMRCCRRAEFKHVNCHMLRHTYASHLVMKGVSLRVVQELLGHSSLEMTMRYSHLAPDHKAAMVERLSEDRDQEIARDPLS